MQKKLTSPMHFDSEPLDRLRPGTVHLSVPIVAGSVQIGIRDAPHSSLIRVSRSNRTVTVRRVDGQPLQVAVHVNGLVAPVFRRSQPELHFMRVGTAVDVGWCTTVPLSDIADAGLLTQLADTIGVFASAKQSTLVAVADRHDDVRAG